MRILFYHIFTLLIVSKAEWYVIKVKPGQGSKFLFSSRGTLTQDKPQVTINEDMVRVDVTTTDGYTQIDFHLKVSPKLEVLKRPKKSGLSALNIIMLGFDSTSHSHFQRKLGKVYKYMKEDLKSFIFNGYTVVGDGTTPALTALLTGKKEEELPEGRFRYRKLEKINKTIDRKFWVLWELKVKLSLTDDIKFLRNP